MKTYALFILVNFSIAVSAQGKIRNGYEKEIQTARDGLKYLQALLAAGEKQSSSQKKRVRENVIIHQQFIHYYELTESLLNEFRIISGPIYAQIDSLKDARERFVDVYVSVITNNNTKGGLSGFTNISLTQDVHALNSKYGLHTVSINIIKGKNALLLLAHEFGHVHYQVQNLADYRLFYIKTYQDAVLGEEETGHHQTDQSGHEASVFEKRFIADYAEYLKIRRKRLTATTISNRL